LRRTSTIYLVLPSPTGSSDLPTGIGAGSPFRHPKAPARPIWSFSPWGLPSRSAHTERWWALTSHAEARYPARRRAHLFTLATALRRFGGLPFCGTFRGTAVPGRTPSR